MTARRRVTDQRLARVLQVGYGLEAIVEGRSAHHKHGLPRDPPKDDLARAILSEAHEESERHREQLAAMLDALGVETPSPEMVSGRIESNYEPARVTTEAVLYDQLCSGLAAYQFYDGIHELLGDERADTDLSVPLAEVISLVEDIRVEERDGVQEVMAAINSPDMQTTAESPNVRS